MLHDALRSKRSREDVEAVILPMPEVGVSEADAQHRRVPLYTALTAYVLIISGGEHP